MSFQNVSTNAELLHGTAFRGTIQATRQQLEAAFGKPHVETDPHADVRTSFILRFYDGEIAHIYEWTPEGRNVYPEGTTWHIGAFNRKTALRVHDAFRAAHGLSARAA